MSWYQFYVRKYMGALVASGMTPQEAADLLDRANKGDAAAQAEATAATQNKGLPYTPLERPRLLEEGLPIPPDYAFWLGIVYFVKNHPDKLERIIKSFWDAQARMIGHLAQAGAGNIITAYSHSFIIALMLEQNYMIRQRGADDLIASLNVLTTAQALTNLLQGFAVPEMITFAATGIPMRGTPWPAFKPSTVPRTKKEK